MKLIIMMLGRRIDQVKSHRIFGLIFDDKLTWEPHINSVRKRCMRLLRTLVASRYESDQDVLLRSFNALVVSVMELGSPAYGSARKNILDKLQTMFNEGLRVALGASKTTRTTNLLNEAGMKDLEFRRTEKIAVISLQIRGTTEYPLKESINTTGLHPYYDRHPRLTRPFSVRAGVTLSDFSLLGKPLTTIDFDVADPWSTTSPVVDFSLSTMKKDDTQPLQYRAEITMLLENHNHARREKQYDYRIVVNMASD